MHYFKNNNYDIGLLTEPYVGKTHKVKNIPGYDIHQFPQDRRVKSCNIVKSGLGAVLGMSNYSTSNLCVVRLLTKNQMLYFVSAYIEPHIDKYDTLNHLENFVKNNKLASIIIGGDFNGWPQIWKSPRSNKRGNDIITFTTTNNLIIGNTGSTPTFETITQGVARSSIIDFTIYTDNLYRRIVDWQVNLDACPSSEHNAIETGEK